MEQQVDLGPFLDEFIREFHCDPSLKDSIYNMLITSLPPALDTGPKQLIERFFSKVSKKRPGLAAEFSELVKRVRNSDLRCADEVIAFLIFHANAQSVVRKEQRRAKLAVLNETLSIGSGNSIKSTPKFHSWSPTFPTPVRCSVSGVRFLDVEANKDRILNGRGEEPMVVDENDLIAEALSALVGIEGRYIVLHEKGFAVASSCAISDPLHSQFLRVLPIGTYYVRLQRFAQGSSPDLIIQALYGFIGELLTEYSSVISGLYSKFTQDSSTVTSLEILIALDEWRLAMKQFILLSEKCASYRGIEIVNYAYALYSRNVPRSLAKQLFENALKTMLGLFHRSLVQWILYGSLIEGIDWLIAVEGNCSNKNAWNTRYKIISNAVPDIFKNFSGFLRKVLMIGRSVGLLQSLNVEDRIFDERKRLMDSVDSLSFYLHIDEATKFSYLINRIYKKMNAEVMVEIVRTYRIRDHLEVVQEHFFLTDECFARAFFYQLSDVANDDLVKLDSQGACHAFTEAVSLCSSFPEQLKNNGHLEATCGVMEKDGQVLPSPRDAKGYPTVRLRYITSVPVSIVLSENVLHRYNRAFEFIWQVVGVDLRLAEIMELHRLLYRVVFTDWQEMLVLCRLFSVVFVRMAYFLSILRTYVNTVIEQCSKKFAAQFDSPSCGDLVKLVESHRTYLTAIENQLFLLEKGKAVHTAILATLDTIKDGVCEYLKFDREFKQILGSELALAANKIDHSPAEVNETKIFEAEEKRVELKTSAEFLLNSYGSLTKNIYAKFQLLVNDIATSLVTMDEASPSLLLQHLRFGNFYS